MDFSPCTICDWYLAIASPNTMDCSTLKAKNVKYLKIHESTCCQEIIKLKEISRMN